MIQVEFVIVGLDEGIDVSIDETRPVAAVAEEIVEGVAGLEHLSPPEGAEGFLVYDKNRQKVFDPSASLSDNGVTSGATLWLV